MEIGMPGNYCFSKQAKLPHRFDADATDDLLNFTLDNTLHCHVEFKDVIGQGEKKCSPFFPYSQVAGPPFPVLKNFGKTLKIRVKTLVINHLQSPLSKTQPKGP